MTVAYSKKWNMPYAIPTTTTHKRWKHYTFPGIHYEDVDTKGFYHYKEPALFYNQRPYDITVQDIPYYENIILEGHFLSHKYFWDYKDEIFPLLGFKWWPFKDAIAIHQRCGDYRNMQEFLPVMPLEYYQKAMNFAINHTGIKKIIVFGDEPEFNKQRFTYENFPTLEDIMFSEGQDETEDLGLMSSFPVIITGNSTFSLWAHYLNKHVDKVCIAPKNWYGPAYGEVNKADLYPPNAIIL